MLLFLGLIVEILFLSLIYGLNMSGVLTTYFFIIVNFYLLLLELKNKESKIIIIILFGFIVRVCILLLDLYGQNIITLFSSGADSESFFRIANQISNNKNMIFQKVRGGYYTKALGILISLIGPNRLFLQYINVVISIGTIITFTKIIYFLDITEKYRFIGISLISFFPMTVIHSSLLLRESAIVFFVTASIYYYMKRYKQNKIHQFVLSSLLVILATILHAGISGIFIMYLLSFVHYIMKGSSINIKKIITSLVVITILLLVINNREIVFSKIAVNDNEELYQNLNNVVMKEGNSTYLQNIYFSNPLQIIIYLPIKLIYFLFSPIIFDWRGVNDLVSFLVDGLFYLFSFIILINYLRKKHKDKMIVNIILAIFITSVIFAFGVSNAGTAIRHRNKIFVLFLIVDLCYFSELNKNKGANNFEKNMFYFRKYE